MKQCKDMNRFIYSILFVLSMAACHDNKKQSNEAAAGIPIEVSRPIIKNVTLTREYPGYLDADATISIVGRVNGTLEGGHYKAGTRVKKGDLLFTIDPTLYRNAVVQAESALKTAKANLDYARDNYERMKIAIESDAVSRIELLKAETAVATGEAAVSNAEAALKTAKTDLAYCYVHAPADGLMDLGSLSAGSYIAGASSPVKLSTLYKDDIMYAYFNITDNQWLRQQMRSDVVGKEQYITFTLGEDKYFTRKARMDFLSPDVNLSTGTLRVRAELTNEDGFLKPGSYISIVLPYETVPDAILVKDSSIGVDQLGKFLYIVDDENTVHYRHIETGSLVNDTLRIVTNGIKPEERYVGKALMKVRNGMKIIPIADN